MSGKKTGTKKRRSAKKKSKRQIKIFPVPRIVELCLYSFIMFWLGVFVERGIAPFNLGLHKKDILTSIEEKKNSLSKDKIAVDFYKSLSGNDDKINSKLLPDRLNIEEKFPKFKENKKKYTSKFEYVETGNNIKQVDSEKSGNLQSVHDAMKYTVQIAAVGAMDDARKISEKLKDKGFSVYIVSSVSGDGKLWYRIRTGTFFSRKDAEKVKSDLLNKTKINGIILKINKQE